MVVNSLLPATTLNWLYLDINSYFATIEQQIDPSLRNKPIVVVAVLSDSTCAIAASREAKLKGIKTGTKIYEAKRLCPDLICILAKHEVYVKYHQRIFQEVEKYLHVDHIFSIDEAACRLTDEQCSEGRAVKLAKQIKLAIKNNVGKYIDCSIGIAPNRYLAKIATNMQKPDGLIVIKPEDIPTKLYALKLQDLPGVGRNTYNKLYSYGITTVEKLYQLPAKLLRKMWGSIWGEKVWYLLRGVDLPVEKTKSSSIGHSQVLAPELRNINSARSIALSLLFKAAQRLRDRGLYTSNIILSVKTIDRQFWVSKIKIEVSSDNTTLSQALLKSWDDLMACNDHKNKIITIKKLSITLTNLEAKPRQLSFGDFSNNQVTHKKQLLSQSIDKLNSKYGRDTVTLGQLPKTNKRSPVIAFGYIPNEKNN